MKKLLLTLSLAIACFAAYAQNTFPSSGNVGIGTTNPSSQLAIGGSNLNNPNNTAADIPYTALTFQNQAGGSSHSIARITAIQEIGDYLDAGALSFSTGIAGLYERMRINTIGNVGIGTINPQANLHVLGSGTSIDGGNNYQYCGSCLIVQANTGSRSATSGAELEFVVPANADGSNPWGQGRIITVAGNSNSSDATGTMILGTRRMYNKLGSGNQWYYGNDLMIDGAGHIGVNTMNTQGYQLAVNGSAIATQIVVKNYGNWPDYVFKPKYHLPNLNEVKTYISKNHHLPGMPSEKEVAEKGIDLGEVAKLQTKKIEELILYLIEKDEKLKSQQQQITQQGQQLHSQQEQIDLLIKQVTKLSEEKLK